MNITSYLEPKYTVSGEVSLEIETDEQVLQTTVWRPGKVTIQVKTGFSLTSEIVDFGSQFSILIPHLQPLPIC